MTELIENIKSNDSTISNIKLNGDNIRLWKEFISDDLTKENVENILSNVTKTLTLFSDPYSKNTISKKILGLGKVQSGKTSYFISSLAMAFDNGYDIAIVLGGTKNNLLDQNFIRLKEAFSNNNYLQVKKLDQIHDIEDIVKPVNTGTKIVLVALKNTEDINLGKVIRLSEELKEHPVVIIDDESDLHTPGAPKLKGKKPKVGVTHELIKKIIGNFKISTTLFITATPQANLLLSTLDELSPDHAVLIEPGNGYFGGNQFHDEYENPNVIEILDSAKFENTIPDSFKKAIRYFILSTARKNLDYDRHYSMLIHPSSFQEDHSKVKFKVEEDLKHIKRILGNSKDVSHEYYISVFKQIYDKYFEDDYFFQTMEKVKSELEHYKLYEINTSSDGKLDQKEEKLDRNIKYKIYVGGNMLERGMTLKNLSCTYIYRDTKSRSPIDTLYQRARWFGYKEDYFDICKVFMTKDLKEKFISVVESENELWNTMKEYLSENMNIKEFPRIFELNDDRLMLTRVTVDKTIVLNRIKSGYIYDLNVVFNDGEIEKNRELVNNIISKYDSSNNIVDMSKSGHQKHLVIRDKYTKLYNDFIKHIKLPKGSKIGKLTFNNINNEVKENKLEDFVEIMVMRYKTYQYRGLENNNMKISYLPQGYDYKTGYKGDKNIAINSNKLQIQFHLVYTDKNKKEDFILLVAFYNPLFKHLEGNTKTLVTGEGFYGKN